MINESIIYKYPIEQIEVRHLRTYLSDRDWISEPFGRKEVLKFRSPNIIQSDKHFEILIPSERNLVDYIPMVINALKGISIYEHRSIDEIIPQVLVFGDLLKFPIAKRSTKTGNISFGEGLPLYDGIRDLLIFSACAEYSPGRKIFPKRLKAATKFADTSLIAPSNYGSYVANILCPIPRKDSLGVAIDEYPPIERRSVIRILRGLKDVSNAVENDNSSFITDNYQRGFNANMCEALTNILEISEGNNINFKASLAPLWVVPDDIVTEISLKPSAKDYLEEASNIFDEQVPRGKCTLFGMALNLKRNPNEGENIIRLVTTIEGRGDATVIIPLDEPSYRRAVDSHKEEQFIKVTGSLEKINGRWYLTNPEGLEVIGDIDPTKVRVNKKLKRRMDRTIRRKIEPGLERKLDTFEE